MVSLHLAVGAESALMGCVCDLVVFSPGRAPPGLGTAAGLAEFREVAPGGDDVFSWRGCQMSSGIKGGMELCLCWV